MAGREFGSPPSVIEEFGPEWRNWLYLLYRKVYKRDNFIFIQAINGIGDGQPSNTMAEGLIGIAPVIFAEDNRRMNQSFSSVIPLDWVQGTDLEIGIMFANTQAQSGATAVVTEIVFEGTSVGEDLSLPGTPFTLTTPLPNNVAANILHIETFFITPQPDINPGNGFQFELARSGADGADTCSGDVGYKQIIIKYQAFINPA